jgi:hypothetical protein
MIILANKKYRRSYLQHFIFFLTYEHSILLSPFMSKEEKETLRIITYEGVQYARDFATGKPLQSSVM